MCEDSSMTWNQYWWRLSCILTVLRPRDSARMVKARSVCAVGRVETLKRDARGPSAGGGTRVLKRAFGTAREQPFAGPRVVRVRERLAIDALQGELQLKPALVSCIARLGARIRVRSQLELSLT
jgi:hypothetical protein